MDIPAGGADTPEKSSTAPSDAPIIDEAAYPPPMQAWYCVSILALAVMINFLDRGILNLLVEPIKADLNLSDVQMSLIMGFAFTFFYAILGLPVARLVDRHSRKHIMSIGIAIWSVMTAMCGFASTFWHLFLARVGVGVGETTSGPSAYSLLSDYFPPYKLPRAIAVMNLGFVAGTGLSLIIGGVVIGFVGTSSGYDLPFGIHFRGWQVVLILVGLPGLLVSALMLTVKEPKRRGIVQTKSSPITEVFQFIFYHKAVYIPLFAGLALRTVQMFGLQMWGAPFYSRTFGWSAEQYAYVGGFSLLIAMPVGLFTGSWLAERWWKKGIYDANIRVTVVSTLVAVPLAILQPIMPSPWFAAGIGFLAALFGGMAAPVENAALQSVTPNHLRGQVTFLFLFIMNVVGMGLGPLVIASFTDLIFSEANIRYSIFLSAILMGPPAVVIFWLGMKPYGRAMEAGGVLPPPPKIAAK
ncbi:spinster family MFS transporter [Hyphococcus sp.]|uniref:spinster family MFS transporter n=1 Tax=Hyphococcus sp. TaxID=2038636 RepID=UPI0026D0B26E